VKILHRITITADSGIQNQLRGLGIEVEQGFVTFEIDESNVSWPELEPMLSAWQAVDVVTTKFTKSELKKATNLRMAPSWQHGYPQPDDDFGYLTASYDLTDYCAECGVGKRQIAPFRMKGEPKWGKKHILQLNWIFDEFFILPEVWESTFQSIGVGRRPVIDHRTGQELRTVVQIDITATAASALQIAVDQPSETCTSCGRRKYLPISKGSFPLFEVEPTETMLKTQEYFGSGASAWKAVVVSSNLFQRITDQKLKGVEFIPCTQCVSSNKGDTHIC